MPSAINPSHHDVESPELSDALGELQSAIVLTAKPKKTYIQRPIDIICKVAYNEGLSHKSLRALLKIIIKPGNLDHASGKRLLDHMYPSSAVPDDVVYTVVGALGQGNGKATLPMQFALTRWLVLVHDFVKHPALFAGLYGALFNLLDMISIRPMLCHLLALITRRKHVRPYRIQMLLELSRNIGSEPPLIGLIRVYKDYYPDVIVGDTTKGKASHFSHPDREWRDHLVSVQERYAQKNLQANSQVSSFRVVRRGLNGAKRSRVSTVPEVHTSSANESSVTLEEIETARDFIYKLDKLDLPNQMVSVLVDPLLQKFLILRESGSSSRRIENWLSSFFEDRLSPSEEPQGDAEVEEVLNGACRYAQVSKKLLPSFERFLQRMLPTWDGRQHRKVVLELMSYLPPSPFEELYTNFLEPLETSVLDDTLKSQIDLLCCYTSMLRNWTVYLQLAQDPPSSASTSYSRLISNCDTLCLALLQNAPPEVVVSTTSPILSFYEIVTGAIAHTNHWRTIRISTPSALLVYQLVFTCSLSTLSRLCAILATYKRAFEGAMSAASAKGGEGGYPRDYVNHFNGFLMDICNCLWRNRAFNHDDVNALGCLVPDSVLPPLRTYADSLAHPLPTLFSLSHSSILCALSIACLREMEDASAHGISVRHAGPVTQRSLAALGNDGGIHVTWPNYRLEVLKWLEERGIGGVGELMYNTMKHLMIQKGGGAATASVTAAGGISERVMGEG